MWFENCNLLIPVCCFIGKLTALDIGNNAISSKGAHYVAEFIKGSKTLTWISIYMNDIGDEVIICPINDESSLKFCHC